MGHRLSGLARRAAATAAITSMLLLSSSGNVARRKADTASVHRLELCAHTQPTEVADRNWAGYVASPDFASGSGAVSGVSGSWIVHDVPKSALPTAMAQWVGIGGFAGDSTLIQVGTESRCVLGKKDYNAWFELYPQLGAPIKGMQVRLGDRVEAGITKVQGLEDVWRITMHDATSGKSYESTFKYSSSQLTAEWIEENPAVRVLGILFFGPVVDFRKAYFGSKYTGLNRNSVMVGNSTLCVGELQNIRVCIASGREANCRMAGPSSLGNDGSSFNVSYKPGPGG